MIEPVFKKSDFVLCNVPVPKGYPQSQTHAGIVIKKGKYYLTTSPYPNPIRPLWVRYLAAFVWKISFKRINLLYEGEDYENPMLYEAIQLSEHHIPTQFRLVDGSPLMQKPVDKYGNGSFCSDPDLSIIDGSLFVLNRTTVRGNDINSTETIVHIIKGHVENETFIQENTSQLFKENFKSPCLIQCCNRYYYFCLDTNSYNDGKPCKALLLKESDDLVNWSKLRHVGLLNGEYEPWHMSVFKNEDRLYAIIACIKKGESHRCWQMLGEFSRDLTFLKIYPTPLSDYACYRGAACVNDTGEFVLYNTTVHEKIKGGKSVDGREVIMAHMPFNELLSNLQEKD